ncbi:T9SS type A sorting domain-containing protein [candidate division KSB1 bacterium]|nr:T9SS type A sorting domain-containing protein [candidate division KSB1 bacterium]
MKSLKVFCVILIMGLIVLLVNSSPTQAGTTDTLSVTSGSGMPGTGGHSLEVRLTNSKTVRGVILKLKDNPESVSVTDMSTASRTTNFKAYKADATDGGTKLLLIPYQTTTNKDITIGSGMIANLVVSVSTEAELGTKTQLQIDSVTVVNSDLTPETVVLRNGSFWIGAKGNVLTQDGTGIDLFDVLRMIDIVLNRQPPPTPYEIWAGDLDNDGDIDIVDIMDAIDIALAEAAALPKPAAVTSSTSRSTVGSAKIEFSSLPKNFVGSTKVSVDLSTSVPIYGLQLWFDVSSGKIQLGDLQSALAMQGLYVQGHRVGDKLSILMAAIDGNPISVGQHRVLDLPVNVTYQLDEGEDIFLARAAAGGANAQPVETFYGQAKTASRIPESFTLYQNSPNPFNMSTRISYDVPALEGKSVHVRLAIYNTKGQLVRVLEDRQRNAGQYDVKWDGRDANGRYVSSGVYFYTLQAGELSLTQKLAVMK